MKKETIEAICEMYSVGMILCEKQELFDDGLKYAVPDELKESFEELNEKIDSFNEALRKHIEAIVDKETEG